MSEIKNLRESKLVDTIGCEKQQQKKTTFLILNYVRVHTRYIWCHLPAFLLSPPPTETHTLLCCGQLVIISVVIRAGHKDNNQQISQLQGRISTGSHKNCGWPFFHFPL